MVFTAALALSLLIVSCISIPIPSSHPDHSPMQYNTEGSGYGSALYRGWSQPNLPSELNPKLALDPDCETGFVEAAPLSRSKDIHTGSSKYQTEAQFVASQRRKVRKMLTKDYPVKVHKRAITRHFKLITDNNPEKWLGDPRRIADEIYPEYLENYHKHFKYQNQCDCNLQSSEPESED